MTKLQAIETLMRLAKGKRVTKRERLAALQALETPSKAVPKKGEEYPT